MSLCEEIILGLKDKERITGYNIKINGEIMTITGFCLSDTSLSSVLVVDGKNAFNIEDNGIENITKDCHKGYSELFYNKGAKIIGKYNDH